jgi:GTP-binding protein
VVFVDLAAISVKAGNGGNGCVSFRREKYVPAGGPDGGDGGRGGNIIFQADSNLSTLTDFRYKRKYAAQSGEDGKPKKCHGKSGEDLVIKVPYGTLVRDAQTKRLLADISDNRPFLAAKGGNGGWGNVHFATPTRQVPRFAKGGEKGQVFELLLELKLLADVGLVGYPNVGKSSLISVVSEARPAIADYHFTTLSPVLGVVRLEEGVSFVMADIPGLIEGASEGAGLGHEFLRHIDRCRLLVHVVDVSGMEGRDPVIDFETINKELGDYGEQLTAKPQIVAGNKCDIAPQEYINALEEYVRGMGYEFFPISAATGKGVSALIKHVAEELSRLPAVKVYEPDEPFQSEEKKDHEVTITRSGGTFTVEGEWLMNLLSSVNFSDYESLQYFQRVLKKSGVIKKLEEAGISDGDTVSIYDVEFDYVR